MALFKWFCVKRLQKILSNEYDYWISYGFQQYLINFFIIEEYSAQLEYINKKLQSLYIL